MEEAILFSLGIDPVLYPLYKTLTDLKSEMVLAYQLAIIDENTIRFKNIIDEAETALVRPILSSYLSGVSTRR
jgi:hypothetical protein